VVARAWSGLRLGLGWGVGFEVGLGLGLGLGFRVLGVQGSGFRVWVRVQGMG
jgi:hypothetical protein